MGCASQLKGGGMLFLIIASSLAMGYFLGFRRHGYCVIMVQQSNVTLFIAVLGHLLSCLDGHTRSLLFHCH